MKRIRNAVIALLCALVAAVVIATPALADDYTYDVRLFQGNHGTLSGGDPTLLGTYGKGDPFSLTVNDIRGMVTVDTAAEGETQYYVKGFRISGQDTLYTSYNTKVNEDMDFVVAYGVQGTMVNYTVRFVVQATGQVLGTATFEGKVGDKPVVAYEYFEGFRPMYAGVSGTLVDGENTWTLPYEAITVATETVTETTTTTTGAAAAAGAAAGAEGAAAAGAEGAAAAGAEGAAAAAATPEATAPQTEEILDVDQTPLAGPDAGGTGTGTGTGTDGTGTGGTGSNTETIGGNDTPLSDAAAVVGNNALVIGIVALASLLAFFLLRRRADDGE